MNALTNHQPIPEPAMLGFLQRAVADPDFDVNKFEVVLAALRAEQAKLAEREFYRAMAAAQNEMEPVRKDALNPHTKSKYASFEAIDANLRPIYTKHGFSVSYRTGIPSRPGAIRMICTVAHSDGHTVEAELEAGLDSSGALGKGNKTDVQAAGSTVSYLRRYIINMVFNVALVSDDDDGEGSRRQQSQPARPFRAEPRRAEPEPKRTPPPPAQPKPTLDETLRGDEIPSWDEPEPPKPEDRALAGAMDLERRILAVATEDELHALAGDPDVARKREWLARNRPELDQMIADALGRKYEQLTREEAPA